MSFNAGSIVSTLTLDLDPFARSMLKAEGIAQVFGQSVATFIANPMLGAVNVAKELGAAFVGFGLDAVRSAADFEQTSIAFETMLGSAEKAKTLMGELTAFGARTPFTMEQITPAARSLLAFGEAGEDVTETLRRLGDLASGLNIPLNDLAQIYGKARVQGRLFMEDINQLSGRGIPIITELAKQFGVAESEIRGLVESGQVGFPQLQRAFASLTSEGSMFGGMMDKQSRSINGLLSTLQDAAAEATKAFGIGLTQGDGFQELLTTAADALNEMRPALQELGGILQQVLVPAMRGLADFTMITKDAIRDMLVAAKLVDVQKLYGNPMRTDRAKQIASLATDVTPQNAEALMSILSAYRETGKEAADGFFDTLSAVARKRGVSVQQLELGPDWSKQMGALRAELDSSALAMNQLQIIRSRAAAGEKVDAALLVDAASRIGRLIDSYEVVNESLGALAQKAESSFVGGGNIDLSGGPQRQQQVIAEAYSEYARRTRAEIGKANEALNAARRAAAEAAKAKPAADAPEAGSQRAGLWGLLSGGLDALAEAPLPGAKGKGRATGAKTIGEWADGVQDAARDVASKLWKEVGRELRQEQNLADELALAKIAAGGSKTADEEAELERLRQKHRRRLAEVRNAAEQERTAELNALEMKALIAEQAQRRQQEIVRAAERAGRNTRSRETVEADIGRARADFAAKIAAAAREGETLSVNALRAQQGETLRRLREELRLAKQGEQAVTLKPQITRANLTGIETLIERVQPQLRPIVFEFNAIDAAVISLGTSFRDTLNAPLRESVKLMREAASQATAFAAATRAMQTAQSAVAAGARAATQPSNAAGGQKTPAQAPAVQVQAGVQPAEWVEAIRPVLRQEVRQFVRAELGAQRAAARAEEVRQNLD